MWMEETIAGIATAPGEGGIGIIRISGEKAFEIIRVLFRPGRPGQYPQDLPRQMIYGHIAEQEEIIDEVLCVAMKAPYTYTTEDVAEIHCHGGFASVRRVLELVIKNGARLAERGEFTKRAFLGGRLDLSQAEAVMDIISAKTSGSLRLAEEQLQGRLSKKIKELRHRLESALAHLTAAVDFPDEDVPEITYGELQETATAVEEEIRRLLATFDTGKILKDGLRTVIAGKPNVGKSSLLNSILKEERAIVTEIAGTTRDVLEEMVNLNGIPLRIMDTAGIRETGDHVEKIGVKRSLEQLELADLVMVILDTSRPLTPEDEDILFSTKEKHRILLANKSDLPAAWTVEALPHRREGEEVLKIAAKKGMGIEELQQHIEDLVFAGQVKAEHDVLLTNARHKEALELAEKSCQDAVQALCSGVPLDVLETDLKNAWEYLGKITGDTVQEDLLDALFSRFCIGK